MQLSSIGPGSWSLPGSPPDALLVGVAAVAEGWAAGSPFVSILIPSGLPVGVGIPFGDGRSILCLLIRQATFFIHDTTLENFLLSLFEEDGALLFVNDHHLIACGISSHDHCISAYQFAGDRGSYCLQSVRENQIHVNSLLGKDRIYANNVLEKLPSRGFKTLCPI